MSLRLRSTEALLLVAPFLLLELLRRGAPLGIRLRHLGGLGRRPDAVFSSLIYGEPLTPLAALGLVIVDGGVFMVELGARHGERVNGV
jgi:small multidrug resistance pump